VHHSVSNSGPGRTQPDSPESCCSFCAVGGHAGPAGSAGHRAPACLRTAEPGRAWRHATQGRAPGLGIGLRGVAPSGDTRRPPATRDVDERSSRGGGPATSGAFIDLCGTRPPPGIPPTSAPAYRSQACPAFRYICISHSDIPTHRTTTSSTPTSPPPSTHPGKSTLQNVCQVSSCTSTHVLRSRGSNSFSA
jgi:hypothetical protein